MSEPQNGQASADPSEGCAAEEENMKRKRESTVRGGRQPLMAVNQRSNNGHCSHWFSTTCLYLVEGK